MAMSLTEKLMKIYKDKACYNSSLKWHRTHDTYNKVPDFVHRKMTLLRSAKCDNMVKSICITDLIVVVIDILSNELYGLSVIF